VALLEEAKFWTAILLRLARKQSVWKTQAPSLAQFMVERIPLLVATLTEAVMLWKGEGKDDLWRFKERFQPVSRHEKELASSSATATSASSAAAPQHEPSAQACTPMDAELSEAVKIMEALLPEAMHPSALKFKYQVDTTFAQVSSPPN